MNIVRALTGFVLACLLAACGGGGGSDAGNTPSNGAPSASAFSISAAKDGSSVSGFALTPGQTLPVTVKAGQQVRFDSNASVSWSASAANASTNVTTSNSSTWASTLALTGTGGVVTLVATSTTDASKSATIVITVEPAFVLTAKIGGVAVSNFSVLPGQSQSLDVQGGQNVELSSTDGVTFSSTQTGGVATPVPVVTTTSWTGNLDSKAGAGTSVVTVKSSIDPTLSATITLNAAVEQFSAPTRALNDYISYTETDIKTDDSSTTYDFTYRVTTINTDKSYLQSDTSDGVIIRMYSLDGDGNRLTRTFTTNNNYCTYSPKRDRVNFPIYVGKTWTSTWTYSCSGGYHEDAQITATVDAYEPVTVGAGTFNALRLHYVTALTNSNDGLLLNGSTSKAAYQQDETCWFAPSVGRTVKCTGTNSYTGTAPSTYLKSYVQEATALGTGSSGNALNGVYKVLTAVGSTLTVAVDLDAKTLAYSAGGTTVSGTLAQSGGEWTLSTPSNSVTSTRLVIKDGFLFGALPDKSSTNAFVAATAAGAREDLIVRTASGFAGSYYNLRFAPCLSTASTCVDDSVYPSQLSLTTSAASAVQATAVSCSQVPTTSTPLKTWLTADPTAGGCLSVATTSSRTWTADAEGMVSSSTTSSPNTFKALFAKVNGKVTGFSNYKTVSGSVTIGYALNILLPVAANNSQSYIGTGLVGLMNRSAKAFVQGDYSSTTGASGSLTFETGSGTFTIQSEALATGVATVNNDANMALFTDGRFGVWFSSSSTTGGLSTAFEKFK